MSIPVTMNVKKVIIIRRKGLTDVINLEIEGSKPFLVESTACLTMRVMNGHGEAWVRKNWPQLTPEIIDA
jgi:hypothetical protein